MLYRQLTFVNECYYIRCYDTSFYIIITLLLVSTNTTRYNLVMYSYKIWYLIWVLFLSYKVLTLPPMSKFPGQPGFTISTWICCEKPYDAQREYFKPVIYW